ncbi:MAG: hypothetical protein P1U46_01445 [Patescibacteria group bacterium]|nr:hypothetical protein [Patescibacteria group bacterium]
MKEILIPTINLLHSQDIKIDSPYLYISDEKYELLSLNDFFDNLSDHDLGKEFIFFLLLSWIKESSYFLIKINGEMYAFFREEIEENVSETKENVNKALH